MAGQGELLLLDAVQVVAFGEGHCSWVSRVAFDPWVCHETKCSAGPGERHQQPVERQPYCKSKMNGAVAVCSWLWQHRSCAGSPRAAVAALTMGPLVEAVWLKQIACLQLLTAHSLKVLAPRATCKNRLNRFAACTDELLPDMTKAGSVEGSSCWHRQLCRWKP
jgi:hypothetical protein